jgi:hypothetical protein
VALRIDARNPIFHHNRGFCCRNMGRYEEAIQEYACPNLTLTLTRAIKDPPRTIRLHPRHAHPSPNPTPNSKVRRDHPAGPAERGRLQQPRLRVAQGAWRNVRGAKCRGAARCQRGPATCSARVTPLILTSSHPRILASSHSRVYY